MATRLPCVYQQARSILRPMQIYLRQTKVISTGIPSVCFAQRSELLPTLLQPAPAVLIAGQRSYAKKAKKEKGKTKKGGANPTYHLTEEELNEVVDFDQMTAQLENILAHLQQDYIDQLSLRTSAGIFDNLVVETADGKFPLIQLGQVTQKNPALIVINMAATPQYTSEVKKAITNSGMNLNPQQDGTTLFISLPKITREHREGMVKSAKTMCNASKEKMRDTQNKYLRDLKKKKDQSEDLLRHVQDHILTATKKHMAEADELMATKQKELSAK